MEGISDIKIIGIDEMRPPRIRKEPYINLYFKLSHKAPSAWCEDFNQVVAKNKYTTRIEPDEGLFIETWLRKPEEIEEMLEGLKKAVSASSDVFIARMKAEALAAAASGGAVNPEDEGEQGRLNHIIARLKFDD